MEKFPIRFDIWVAVAQEEAKAARSLLAVANRELSEREVLRRVVKSYSSGEALLFAEGLDWKSVIVWEGELRGKVSNVTLFQAGYGPVDIFRLKQCLVHRVYFGGIWGCPVCALTSGGGDA